MTEKCVVCGLRWHVCKDKVIPPGGYVCPHCEYRRRRSYENSSTSSKKDVGKCLKS